MAEIDRCFECARSRGTADSAGRASLAYHAPATGPSCPHALHAEAIVEADHGLSKSGKVLAVLRQSVCKLVKCECL